MKFIFLDIDGVLNNGPFLRDQVGKPYDPSSHVDPENVKWLNQLIKATGAAVVISSTWRHMYTLDILQDILVTRFGIEASLLRATPILHADRHLEIQEFLATNPCDGYVILDDLSDMGELQNHLVVTNFDIGLNETNIKLARGILEQPVR